MNPGLHRLMTPGGMPPRTRHVRASRSNTTGTGRAATAALATEGAIVKPAGLERLDPEGEVALVTVDDGALRVAVYADGDAPIDTPLNTATGLDEDGVVAFLHP